MKHTWLISAAAFALAASGAVAADSPSADTHTPPQAGSAGGPAAGDMPAAKGDHHPWTLAEARQHAHARADKLDKMTEKEWQAEEAKHHEEFSQKWHSMSPEERQAWKDMKHKNMPKQSGSANSPASASPSAGGAAPAATGGSN